MSQLTSPFLEVKWGWNYGESGWNIGMDEDLVKFSYLFDRNIDGIVDSLPASVEGTSYFLTTDNRVYYVVNNTYYSTPIPRWFELVNKSNGYTFIFNGTSLVQNTGLEDLKNKVIELENIVSTLITSTPTSPEKSNQTVKIAIIGDSLSQNSTRNYNWVTQACCTIQEMTGKQVQIFNAAIAGSTWNHALNVNQHRGGTKSQVDVVVEFEPDYVVCAMGINDAIYVGGFTATQIINNAKAVRDALKNALSGVKMIYAEESPHDITASGLSPTGLINNNCIPASHQTITLKGLTNVRVNNSTYLNTNISSTALSKHQIWGSATATIRTLFDGFFSVNIWKMSRMGCMSDNLHIDQLGQTLWSWQFITYLAGSTNLSSAKINFASLDISTLNASNINIDLFFNEVSARTIGGNMPAGYRGYNVFQKLSGWMLKSPGARMHTDSAIATGAVPLTLFVEDAIPNSAVYLASESTNFSNVSRNISSSGNHLQTFAPGTSFTDFRTAGTHSIWLAAVSPDNTSTDVFTTSVLVSSNYP